jgi:ParB family chromosome partitioning protein
MGQFEGLLDFDVAALKRSDTSAAGAPRELPVDRIEPDPDNVRRSFDETALDELAATIQADGLLQAITVREHPEKPGAYLVCYGERRLRAVQRLGHPTIKAVIVKDFDPYGQAIENLQREELNALDLAEFIRKREAAGDSRTTIAKRLGKPKSFISEIAQLSSAPEPIKRALQENRIPDARAAYVLTREYNANPEAVTQLLAGEGPVTRQQVTQALSGKTAPRADNRDGQPPAAPRNSRYIQHLPWDTLVVRVGDRSGHLSLEPGVAPDEAIVRFADGSQEGVPLRKIILKKWIRA